MWFMRAGILALVTLSGSFATLSGPNTNTCVVGLPNVASCATGIGEDCCNGVKYLVENLCPCNPVVYNLLPTATQLFTDVKAACKAQFPEEWADVPSVYCWNARTFSYGCWPRSDIAIDNRRLETVLRFRDAMDLQQNVDSPAGACMNVSLFADGLSTAMDDDTSLYVPWGIGTYRGTLDIAEYLAISFESLNHGFWRVKEKIPQGIAFSPNSITNVAAWPSDTFDGLLSQVFNNFGSHAQFSGCETSRFSTLSILPNTGSRDVFQTAVWGAQSKRWGVEDICRVHEVFCAPNPDTRQFDSTQECIDFMESLPLYSAGCGPQRPLAGLSLPCKWKHHFMVQVNPEAHCPHIGFPGTVDANGAEKCTDAYGCSADEGQDAWPPMDAYGDNTPAAIQAIIDASDVGFENEDLGCVL